MSEAAQWPDFLSSQETVWNMEETGMFSDSATILVNLDQIMEYMVETLSKAL